MSESMRCRIFYLLLAIPSLTLAHNGEDHGEKAAPIITQEGAVITATGKAFEAVIKIPYAPLGSETKARVMISEYETNAPVSGADLDLTFKGANGFKASGK